jgi:predicted homoserine dehydrogenase-like protein
MQRREFLKTSAQAGAAAWTAVSADRVMGANDRLRVGLIGCGGRGTLDARNMRGTLEDIQAVAPESYHGGNPEPRLREPRNVDIAAVCDANSAKTDAAKRWTPQATAYDDFRKLLADKSIDAVIIATPDPWHAQMMILACEAGKDVYLEPGASCRSARSTARRTTSRRRPKWCKAARSAR